MQRFRDLALQDKAVINQILSQAPWMVGYCSSELVFENLFVWTVTEPFQIGEFDRFLLLRCFLDRQLNYLPPVASTEADFLAGMNWIRENDPTSRVLGLTGDMIRLASQKDTLILYDDYYAEYLYSPTDLANLPGQKYRRKRNLLHQFQQYESHLTAYTSTDYEAVKDLLARYLSQGGSADDHNALLHALKRIDELDLFCDLCWVNHQVVALSIGCISAFGHGIVLFEKADIDFAGSYAAIVQMVAKKRYMPCQVVSRQEDIGIPELRKAKTSYHPLRKERKCVAMFDPIMQGLYQLYRTSFDDSADYVDYFFLRQARRDRAIVIDNNHQVVSGLHLVDKTLRFNQVDWHCPFVVAAATAPDHRRQGLMKQVMSQALTRLVAEKVAFLSLYPVDKAYYDLYGFVPYVFTSPLPETLPEVACTIEQTVSAETLSAIYDRAVKLCEGHMVRTIPIWHEHINRLAQDGIDFYLIKQGVEAIGFLAKKADEIEEILLDQPVKPIIKDLDCSALRVFDSEGRPENMIRIVSLLAFLSQYQPPLELEAQTHIQIVDDWIEANNVTLSLAASQGKMRVSESKKAEVFLSIAEFTRLVMTGEGPEALQPFFPKRICHCFDRY